MRINQVPDTTDKSVSNLAMELLRGLGHVAERMKISVACITKGEDSLEMMLESVKDLADEIVLVTDQKQLLDKWGSPKIKGYYREWNDDFAEARNFSFSKCTGDYILWLDSDDIVPEEAAKLLRSNFDNPGRLTEEGKCFYSLPIINIINGEAYGQIFIQARITPNNPLIKWEGVIHETHVKSLSVLGLKDILVDNIILHHTGYESEEILEKKVNERNIPALLKQERSMMNVYNLASSCMCVKDWGMATAYFERLFDEYEEEMTDELKNYVILAQGMCHFFSDEFEHSLQYFEKTNRGERYYFQGVVAIKGGRFGVAESHIRTFLNHKEELSAFGSPSSQLRYLAWNFLCDILLIPVREVQRQAREEFPTQPKWRKQE